jgi:hypothetical protein
MEELAVYSFSNGNPYSTSSHENDFDEDEVDENEHVPVNYPPEDEVEPAPVQPVQPVLTERGGRRKGVPRRLQLSPEVVKTPSQRLLPASLSKSSSTAVHHHEQPILTSDQEDETEIEDLYQQNQTEQNYLQLDFVGKELIDKNNNPSYPYEENEDILETVDDILADVVAIIVRDIKQQRKKHTSQSNGHSQNKVHSNGKTHSNGLSESHKR